MWPWSKPKPELAIPSSLRPRARWRLKSTDGSPWPSKLYRPVDILAVQDGWVRYRIGDFLPDERMKVETFLAIYEVVA